MTLKFPYIEILRYRYHANIMRQQTCDNLVQGTKRNTEGTDGREVTVATRALAHAEMS